MTTRLCGIATAVPEHTARQRHSLHFMRRVVDARAEPAERDRAMLFLESIHDGCGIDRRYSVIGDFTRSDPEAFEFFPDNWRLEPFPSTKRRMEVYESASVELAEQVANAALEDAELDPEEVTHLVFVTCTGSFAPGPDILLTKRLGLGGDVRRTVIGFMGCYGAFNGMRTADQIVESDPSAVVLQISVELCTLHYQCGLEPETIVGNCLFGDGAAAAVYTGEQRASTAHVEVVDSHCRITDDSLEQMQWHIGDHGFTMVLDVEIPSTLLSGGARFIDELLSRNGLHTEQVGSWLVHPGGPKIIDAVRDAAELSESEVALSRQILREYGNMSSSTILFVLQRALEQERPGPMAMLGFGPGLTMEGAVLQRC